MAAGRSKGAAAAAARGPNRRGDRALPEARTRARSRMGRRVPHAAITARRFRDASAIADGTVYRAGIRVPVLKITASARAFQRFVARACTVMACILMADIVMADIVMAYIVMADIAMARP